MSKQRVSLIRIRDWEFCIGILELLIVNYCWFSSFMFVTELEIDRIFKITKQVCSTQVGLSQFLWFIRIVHTLVQMGQYLYQTMKYGYNTGHIFYMKHRRTNNDQSIHNDTKMVKMPLRCIITLCSRIIKPVLVGLQKVLDYRQIDWQICRSVLGGRSIYVQTVTILIN